MAHETWTSLSLTAVEDRCHSLGTPSGHFINIRKPLSGPHAEIRCPILYASF